MILDDELAQEERRLFVVPHAALFAREEAERDLPTFNSNAVLAAIHRLPGLAEWFIYSDDDLIIGDSSTGAAVRCEVWRAVLCLALRDEEPCPPIGQLVLPERARALLHLEEAPPGLSAWWDDSTGRQRLYLQQGSVHGQRKHSNNNWEEVQPR